MEDQLHAMAQQATQLRDFGEPSYRAGLGQLLAACDDGPRFTEMGAQFAIGSVVGTLIARLRAQEGWRQRPDSLRQEITRPLVITGVPRTGTTALHKLLAMDSQFQGLERWLTETPMVRPPRASWEGNPHYVATLQGLQAFFAAAPEMRTAHDMVAGDVDECLEVLRQSVVSNRFASGMYIPLYDHWFQQQDEHDSYRRFADVLRLIGADQVGQRWLLKNPGHIATLDCLLEVFPDACIVQTHRDPGQAIPSLCSVLRMAWSIFEGDAARGELIGPREMRYWSRAVDHADRVRAGREQQFFDVDHRRFHADPLGTVRAIYQYFELSLSGETESKMRSWIAASPTTQHGAHRYNVADYGVSPGEIREQFARYCRQYDLH